MSLRPAALAGALLAALLLGGCGSSGVPDHTADEQKAVDELKNQTPQQQIDRIQNGPMPESAKKAMIDKIKKENGLK
ncbi:hypothetical protein BH11ARM2_BH11ARM2_08260 [soil metagenome]